MRGFRLLLQSLARLPLLLPLLFLFFGSIEAGSPCSTRVETMVVRNPSDAEKLTEALLCDGRGTFFVDWHGGLFLSRTVSVSNGSTLNVTGLSKDAGAFMNADGTGRLFEVDLASTLSLQDMTFTGGNGALSVSGGSYVEVIDCSWNNNIASNGGE